MYKPGLILCLLFCPVALAAENDAPDQDGDQQQAEQAAPSTPEAQDNDNELIAAEATGVDGVEEESSTRFIPTEEISQDLGVSFPVDI